jgi:hypothetical protein
MEERAGERRSVLGTDRFLSDAPLPVPLPARSSRGEGENHVAKSLSKVRDFSSLYYGFREPARFSGERGSVAARKRSGVSRATLQLRCLTNWNSSSARRLRQCLRQNAHARLEQCFARFSIALRDKAGAGAAYQGVRERFGAGDKGFATAVRDKLHAGFDFGEHRAGRKVTFGDETPGLRRGH